MERRGRRCLDSLSTRRLRDFQILVTRALYVLVDNCNFHYPLVYRTFLVTDSEVCTPVQPGDNNPTLQYNTPIALQKNTPPWDFIFHFWFLVFGSV